MKELLGAVKGCQPQSDDLSTAAFIQMDQWQRRGQGTLGLRGQELHRDRNLATKDAANKTMVIFNESQKGEGYLHHH